MCITDLGRLSNEKEINTPVEIWKNIIFKKDVYLVVFIGTSYRNTQKAHQELRAIDNVKHYGVMPIGQNAVMFIECEKNNDSKFFSHQEYLISLLMMESCFGDNGTPRSGFEVFKQLQEIHNFNKAVKIKGEQR